MTGSTADNWFRGEGGNDTIDGGGGFDTASYASSTAGVVADLATGTAADGLGSTDRLLNIENLSGSGTAADTLFGSAGDNLLIGNGGNDTLDGRDGADRVFGGDGNDRLVGGNGNDTLLGSVGADLLNGGQGADVFRYTFASHEGDSIVGFRAVDDAFQIDASGFGGGSSPGSTSPQPAGSSPTRRVMRRRPLARDNSCSRPTPIPCGGMSTAVAARQAW